MRGFVQRGHVVFDVDDVLANFWGTVLPELNAHYNKDIAMEQIKEYTGFVDLFDITADEFREFLCSSGCLERLTVNGTYKHFINKFADCDDFYVSVISSRDFHPEAYKITTQWLRDNDIRYDQLLISGKTKKHDLVSHADVIIDDHFDNIVGFIDSGKLRGNAYLVSKPWNAHVDTDSFKKVFRI